MAFAPLDSTIEVDDDWYPNLEEDRKVSVVCDEEQDGMECNNGVDILVSDEFPDIDGLYWNRDTAAAVRFLGWKITADHDFCPEHSTKSAEETDAGVKGWKQAQGRVAKKALANA